MVTWNMESHFDTCLTQLIANDLRIEDLVALMSANKRLHEGISANFGEKIRRFKSYASTSSKNGALRKCAAEGHFEELVWLMGRWETSVDDIRSDQYAIFKCAAYRGHLDILMYLIRKANPMTMRNIIKDHLTPLAKKKCEKIDPRDHDIEGRKQKVVDYLVQLELLTLGISANFMLILMGAAPLRYDDP